MIIEEMRAKALEYTSLYFPDLRWSQPEFQDALAAFFHYILTGAWPPSNHVFHRSIATRYDQLANSFLDLGVEQNSCNVNQFVHAA
jgi:hypothetical protein